MALISLPVEIVGLILAEICDKRSLLHLISTCKLFRAHAEPRLYERITLSYHNAPDSDKFIISIRLLHESIVTRTSSHASRVHSLTLISPNQTHHDFHITVEHIDQILERLCNLKSLSFSLDVVHNDSWVFFPCLKRSPPPFQLERLAWAHSIHMQEGFYSFLSQQQSISDLILLSPSFLPSSTTISHIDSMSGSYDCLKAFPKNHIVAFKWSDSRITFLPHEAVLLVETFSRLRAFSCQADVHLLNVLAMEFGTLSVMPNVEFLEIRAWALVQVSPAKVILRRLSRKPLRYARLPPLSRTSPFPPQQLFKLISTLECIDYMDESRNDPKVYQRRRHSMNDNEALLSGEGVATVWNRYRRGSTTPILITLPPRRLDQWELDLLQTE